MTENDKEKLKKDLSPEEYYVTQNQGTEPAFSGKYDGVKTPGVYNCIVCGEPLFSSKTKYDSGSGWPSFYEAISEDAIEEIEDRSLMMTRIETVCSKCEAHLGHVFPDGPAPTGLRYCMNSLSLAFEKSEKK